MKILTMELGNSPQKEDSVFVYNKTHTAIDFILKFNRDELKALLKKGEVPNG
ncbi:hypothetical protein LCGC14_1145950 [marine sediment metagenome]|uniref:Uncharacterized protein n=1 Tax=marine sediment metagenome TaxID=412755 RepID=A0A0F9MK33_9ZZZZ